MDDFPEVTQLPAGQVACHSKRPFMLFAPPGVSVRIQVLGHSSANAMLDASTISKSPRWRHERQLHPANTGNSSWSVLAEGAS